MIDAAAFAQSSGLKIAHDHKAATSRRAPTAPSRDGSEYRHSSVTSVFSNSDSDSDVSSSRPTKRRRVAPPKPKPQPQATSSQTKSKVAAASPQPMEEIAPRQARKTLTKPGFLGEFIVQAWATTSDTKHTTYIRPGDSVTITRSDADARFAVINTTNASSKGKTGNGSSKQSTLAFASKGKTPNGGFKKPAKENTMVYFHNERGSGTNSLL